MNDGIELEKECGSGHVVDRFKELESDMRDGFKGLRNDVEKMDSDELRRDIDNLMMIGHSQMDTIRRQRREIDWMQRDLLSLNGERARTIQAAIDLLGAMGVAYDIEDDSPSKWLRMAASVARERRCELITATVEDLGASAVTDLDRKESMTQTALVAVLGVFVLCCVVWTVLMVSAWVR